MWERFSVASTVGRVADGGALLLWKPCYTSVEGTCGALLEKGNHPNWNRTEMVWGLRMIIYRHNAIMQ